VLDGALIANVRAADDERDLRVMPEIVHLAAPIVGIGEDFEPVAPGDAHHSCLSIAGWGDCTTSGCWRMTLKGSAAVIAHPTFAPRAKRTGGSNSGGS
jgi:hypothetical protein